MVSVSLVRCKNEALKELYFKSIIKCFKRVKIYMQVARMAKIHHTDFPP